MQSSLYSIFFLALLVTCSHAGVSKIAAYKGNQEQQISVRNWGTDASNAAAASTYVLQYPTVGATLEIEKVGDKLSFTCTLDGETGWVAIGMSNGLMVGSQVVLVDKWELRARFRQIRLDKKRDQVATVVNQVELENLAYTLVDNKRVIQFTATKIGELDFNLNGINKFIVVTGPKDEFGFHGPPTETTQIQTVDFSKSPDQQGEEDDTPTEADENGIVTINLKKFSNGKLELEKLPDGQLKFVCTLQGTTGWVAVGFSDGSMKGSNVVLAVKGSEPEEANIDAKSGAGVKRAGQPNIRDASFQVADGKRIVTFTTAKIAQKSVDLGSLTSFIVVDGPSDSFGYHGDSSASTEVQSVNLATGVVGGADSEQEDLTSKAVVHGYLMMLCFMFFMPLAVLPSVFRSYLPDKLWWTIHRPWQVLNCTMAFIAFILAIMFVEDTGGDHFDTPHKQLGLAVILFTAVQPALAVAIRHGNLRPQWRVSHVVVALFLFFGGLYNSVLALDLPVFQTFTTSQQSSLETTVYAGAGVTSVASLIIIAHQVKFYTTPADQAVQQNDELTSHQQKQ